MEMDFMKCVIAIGLLNAALLAGVLVKKDVVVHAAAGGGGVPAGNGDVNGDGKYDITDAVYYLNWQFLAGPEPVAIVSPPPAGSGLPATGQTKCYDSTGAQIPCDNGRCPGQDGFYQASCMNKSRFVDNGDGTVSDTCMGLMWQKNTADANADGRIDGKDNITWCDALNFCDNLEFAGFDDWRLPNVRELQSIVDYGRKDPAIDPVFGAASAVYWSSTSVDSRAVFAWLVHFFDGPVFYVSDGPAKGGSGYVRAVRTAP
jgi:hypothetical protein